MRDRAIGVQFRCQYPPETLQAFARLTEASGFDELWIVEDCFWSGGIASVMAALCGTERIAVGLGIMPAVARNVAFATMEAATIARLFPHRLQVGLGHGVAEWMKQVGAFPSSQLAALGESTTAMRALLRGETYSADGKYVHLDQVNFDLPPEHVPPVMLGVRGPQSLVLSGRVADGTILAEMSSPAYVIWAREQIAAGAAQADRSEPHRVTVYSWCSIGDDGPTARAKLRPYVTAALLSPDAGPYTQPLGIADEVQALRERGEATFADAMPDAWIDQFTVSGTPDDAAAAVERLYVAGADAVVLTPLMEEDGLGQVETIARALLPWQRRS